MDRNEIIKNLGLAVDFTANYYENIETYPVKSNVKPKEIINSLAQYPPRIGEEIEEILQDVDKFLMKGITHWQSPNFYAYFPSNNSLPSMVAEMVSSAIGAQCMVWETSPAAAELEELVMNWLRDMIGLPKEFCGVIQDTASTATLTALLTAREKYTNWDINENGFPHNRFRIYCSSEAHSSIDKAVRIAGFGYNNLVKIKTDSSFAMNVDDLIANIESDIAAGMTPLAVVCAIGTTGSTAIDPLAKIATVCDKFDLWLHVDAALAGTALVLPEMRYMIEGVQRADSFVFNPHKWMFTNFDCSAYFVSDKDTLIKTFSITPEYLKTAVDSEVNNYRDWGIQLGRRFRALKLWFVIRNFGTEGIENKVRYHIELTKKMKAWLEQSGLFEIMAPVPLNTICFRMKYANALKINDVNAELLKNINASGKIYITHTKLNGEYVLRFVIGQTYVEDIHIRSAFELIENEANKMLLKSY